MPQSLTQLYVHLVFHAKHDLVPLPSELLHDLHAYLSGIFRNLESLPIQIGGTHNHVHVLFVLSKTISLADVAKTVKANSSSWVKAQSNKLHIPMLEKFQWQGGYGAFSVSESQLNVVKQYIVDQEEHHQTMTFQEEYLLLLKKHNVKYDERYLWE